MEHVFSVNSLDELSRVMPAAGGTVFTLGHTKPGDGGGGLFHWQTDSVDPPDSGTVVSCIDEKTGRWKRIDSGPINVRWFGALGDGSDATQALQAALDAAHEGGTVYIPSGVYSIKRSLKIPQGTTLYGDGFLTRLQFTGKEWTCCLAS